MHLFKFASCPAGGALLVMSLTGAQALEEAKGEREALKACEKSLCGLVVRKGPASGDFTCTLSKTWAKADIRQGTSSRQLEWGFGDARCTVDLKLARATIISALTDSKSTLQFPDHKVTCIIEGEKAPTTVIATLAPKATFERGRVKKVWVNLKKVEGPTVMKGLAFAVARLEDSIGLFHGTLVRSLNKMLHEKCPRTAAAHSNAAADRRPQFALGQRVEPLGAGLSVDRGPA